MGEYLPARIPHGLEVTDRVVGKLVCRLGVASVFWSSITTYSIKTACSRDGRHTRDGSKTRGSGRAT